MAIITGTGSRSPSGAATKSSSRRFAHSSRSWSERRSTSSPRSRRPSGDRYAEALGHRFLALVLELDRRKALRFHASKTPAEYVGEARLTDRGRASLASLVAQLYRHLFGAVPCNAGEYESFGDVAQELARGQYVVPA